MNGIARVIEEAQSAAAEAAAVHRAAYFALCLGCQCENPTAELHECPGHSGHLPHVWAKIVHDPACQVPRVMARHTN